MNEKELAILDSIIEQADEEYEAEKDYETAKLACDAAEEAYRAAVFKKHKAMNRLADLILIKKNGG
jgi:hypothetical protein